MSSHDLHRTFTIVRATISPDSHNICNFVPFRPHPLLEFPGNSKGRCRPPPPLRPMDDSATPPQNSDPAKRMTSPLPPTHNPERHRPRLKPRFLGSCSLQTSWFFGFALSSFFEASGVERVPSWECACFVSWPGIKEAEAGPHFQAQYLGIVASLGARAACGGTGFTEHPWTPASALQLIPQGWIENERKRVLIMANG